MKKYDLKNINVEEYKLYFYEEKYLEIGEKILNNKYKILDKYKDDNRTFVALIEIENKKYILKIPKNEYKKIGKKFLTLFKRGEALSSLINIRSARNRGLTEVMDVYLAGEKRKNGMISDSFFLSEYIEGKICLENDKVEKILELMKKMHKLGLYHGDCNPYNFLFTKEGIRMVDTKCKKMLFGNYKAHYDNLTLIKYFKKIKYQDKKNFFYYLALIRKKGKSLIILRRNKMEINLKRITVNFFSCFIINREKRKNFREKMLVRRIRCEEADKYCVGEPVEPWAFIRVRNEIGTIDSCLKSILPVIKKGVIGYNDCDDGTEEYILEFCKQNSGFIPFKYPYSVYPPSHEAYRTNGEEEKKLPAYYNAVLSKIPKNEWIIKIDCDHVYDAEKLKKILYLPQKDEDCIIIPRLNLYYDGAEVYVFKKNSYIEVKDNWLIKNDNLKFVLSRWIHKENGKEEFRACEKLYVKNRNLVYVELNNYHFPTIKNWRNLKIDKNDLMSLDEYIKIAPIGTKIDRKMLDKNKILNICKKFNLEYERILP